MKARYARLIRIGIMAKCLPYKSNIEPDPVFGGYYTTLDLTRLGDFQDDWIKNNHISLVREAFERTERWTSTRYV